MEACVPQGSVAAAWARLWEPSASSSLPRHPSDSGATEQSQQQIGQHFLQAGSGGGDSSGTPTPSVFVLPAFQTANETSSAENIRIADRMANMTKSQLEVRQSMIRRDGNSSKQAQ